MSPNWNLAEKNEPINRPDEGLILLPIRAERKHMKDKIVLSNNTEIVLETGASISALEAVFPTWADAAAALEQLTPANLVTVQIQNEDGLTVGRYTDMVLQPGAWDVRADGIHITIRLREKTDMEKAIEDLRAGQEVQDGAIDELGGLIGGEA